MDRGFARCSRRIFLLFLFLCAFLYTILFAEEPAPLQGRSLDDRPGIATIVVALALPETPPPTPNVSVVVDLRPRRRHLRSKLSRAAMAPRPKKRARFLLTNKKLFQKSDKVSIERWKHAGSKVSQTRKVSEQKTLKMDTLAQQTVYSKGSGENATSQRRLPRALIIGVKKGGTRALLEFIRLHPDVRAVGPETHFFDRHFHEGLDWYRQQMPPTLESQLTMEKTPSYFVTREVPRRIRDSMDRDIKLLVVVRDPVTRAISDYAQTVSKRRHMKSFDELAFLNNATGLVDTSWGAIKIGVYARHLEHWLQCFPLKQFHFVSGERLIKDPAGEMAKVQAFLGIRQIVTENHFYFNETKGFPCLKKSEGNGSPRCLGKTKGRTHPLVDNSTIQNLRDFFRPFNLKFYQMTGVDFGWP